MAAHLIDVGTEVQQGWKRSAQRAGLPIHVSGIPPLSHFSIEDGSFENDNAAELTTIFTRLMLIRGFLAGSQLYASYAHQPQHIESYLSAVDEVFGVLADTLRKGQIEQMLQGPVKHSTFRRLTG